MDVFIRSIASALMALLLATNSAHSQVIPPGTVPGSFPGMDTSGGGGGVARSLACERARLDAEDNCRNAGCPDGCKRILDCDCACIVDDFDCVCNAFAQFCDMPGDSPEDPIGPEEPFGPDDPFGFDCDPRFQSCAP